MLDMDRCVGSGRMDIVIEISADLNIQHYNKDPEMDTPLLANTRNFVPALIAYFCMMNAQGSHVNMELSVKFLPVNLNTETIF